MIKQSMTQLNNLFLNSKAQTTINEHDIDDVFQPIYTTILSSI